MDDIIRTAVNDAEDTDIIKKQVENKTDDNLIRKPVIGIGGDTPAPTIEEITITENGTTTATSDVDGYNPIHVNVPQPTITSITITENGIYPAPEGAAYSPVIVNVAEPTTKVVSFYDFSEEAYDLERSIVGDAPSMVFNTTGQGYFHPAYYLNDFNDYEIEIEFGTVDNSQGGWELGGFKIYGQNFCVWLNYENNVLTAFNTSGNFQIPNRTLADFSNKTIKFIVSHKISPTTNDTLTEVSLLFEGETTPIKLGDVDNKLPYYPYIGSLSGNAIRGINIKSMKITQSKWVIENNRELESEVE